MKIDYDDEDDDDYEKDDARASKIVLVLVPVIGPFLRAIDAHASPEVLLAGE